MGDKHTGDLPVTFEVAIWVIFSPMIAMFLALVLVFVVPITIVPALYDRLRGRPWQDRIRRDFIGWKNEHGLVTDAATYWSVALSVMLWLAVFLLQDDVGDRAISGVLVLCATATGAAWARRRQQDSK